MPEPRDPEIEDQEAEFSRYSEEEDAEESADHARRLYSFVLMAAVCSFLVIAGYVIVAWLGGAPLLNSIIDQLPSGSD